MGLFSCSINASFAFDIPAHGSLSQAITAANNTGVQATPFAINLSSGTSLTPNVYLNTDALSIPIVVNIDMGNGASGIARGYQGIDFNGNKGFMIQGNSIKSSIHGMIFKNSGQSSITNSQNLTLSNMSFQSNSCLTGSGSGGAILNNYILNITDSDFSGNKATNGGAILTSGTNNQLNITTQNSDITFDHNSATGASNSGGGAINANAGTTKLSANGHNIIFSNNSAGYGGAIATSANKITFGSTSGGRTIFDSNSSTQMGGAIYAFTVSGSSFANVDFKNNTSGTYAGAMYLYDTGGANINGSTFTNNNAGIGAGALYNVGVVTIYNTGFSDNYTTNGNGGAISSSGNLTIGSGNLFSDNNADNGNGGAIYNSSIFLSVNSSTFDGNQAKSGGAIYNDGNGQQIISSATFTNNTATAGDGGAINAPKGTLSVSSSKFGGNVASGNGGAINTSATTSTINGTNFTDNSAKNGGAIYNNSNLTMNGSVNGNSISGNSATENGGAIYNNKTLNLTTTSGYTLAFHDNGANGLLNDIYNVETATTNINGAGGTVSIGSGISGGGQINKSGNGALTLEGTSYNTEFKGAFSQTGGTTNVIGSFFGGENTINGGTFNWLNSIAKNDDATLKVLSGTINVGTASAGQTLLLNNSSDVIEKAAIINLYQDSAIINDKGTITFNPGDTWQGLVVNNNVTNVVDGFIKNDSSGYFVQTEADAILNIGNNAHFTTGSNTNIADGTINVTTQNVGHSTLEVSTNSLITDNIIVNFDPNSYVKVTGGTLQLNENDNWQGRVSVADGNLICNNLDSNGAIFADGGNVFLETGKLDIASGSHITSPTNTHISLDSTMNILGGDVTMGENSTWDGTINLSSGTLVLENFKEGINTNDNIFTQTGGDFVLELGSNYSLGNNVITGGNIHVYDDAVLTLTQNSVINGANNLYMMTNGLVNAMNGGINQYNFTGQLITGPTTANFNIDIDPVAGTYDQFIFDKGSLTTQAGNVVTISDFNLLDDKVLQSPLVMEVFAGNGLHDQNIIFGATDKVIKTPIGKYSLSSYGDGFYGLNWEGYNPNVYSGAISSLATYYRQLVIDNALFDHVYVDSQSQLARNRDSNKYALSATIPQFAPYQYKREGGSLWFKGYSSIEKLSLTQDLTPNNTIYGGIIGADFDVINLRNGWKFMPTAYLSYDGGRQSFEDTQMFQNGGQGGVMGTWMKGEFIGSLLAFGGGYNNEMTTSGLTSNFGNWLAGVAAKAAYDFHPNENLIIQPTLFAAYTAIGAQNWFSSAANAPMHIGYFNGMGIAPGFNIIYGKNDWSVYSTISYMFNINDKVKGSVAGNDLPWIQMKHGYIEYGMGATKTFKERFVAYVQTTFRNGGRTGVAFQLGLTWKL